MAYFPNGSAGMDYEARYCDHCVHQENEAGEGCAVWLAHLLFSYKEANNPDSILHILIPDEGDMRCKMFVQKPV